MKIAGKALLVLLTILWALSVCALAQSASISGSYYEDEISKPLAGALIALYKADDNTLVDYTYTRNDGTFVLKGPAASGKYYVVATKDKFSQKKDFDYYVGAAPINLMIQHHQPKSTFGKAKDWVGTRFDDVIKVLIGLVVGFLFKLWDDWRKARQTVQRENRGIKESCNTIIRDSQDLQKIATDYGTSGEGAAKKVSEFVKMGTTIDTRIKDLKTQLDAKSALHEAIYTGYKTKGRDDYVAFRNFLEQLKKLTNTIVTNPAAILDAPDRDVQLKAFETLKDTNFLKNY